MPFCNLKKIFYLLLAALAVLLSGCTAADPYKTISTSIQGHFSGRQFYAPPMEGSFRREYRTNPEQPHLHAARLDHHVAPGRGSPAGRGPGFHFL